MVKGFGDNKARGIDGFNAKFFKSGWNVIKNDIVEAIKYFFEHKRLYKTVNYAMLTLIPKTKEAKTMRDETYCLLYYIV